MYACRCNEATESYVWEDLGAAASEQAAVAARHKTLKGANLRYAVAGTMALENLAALRSCPSGAPRRNLQIFHLSKVLGISRKEVQRRLDKLLQQHEKVWRECIESLGSESFMNRWPPGGPRDATH